MSDENTESVAIRANIVDSSPSGLRVQALEDLAKNGDRAASDDLIRMLSIDPDYCYRLKAARALGRLCEMGVIEQLKKACNDPKEKVCKAAREALENIERRGLGADGR